MTPPNSCRRVAPCGALCCLTELPHTIHGCSDWTCIVCHGGAVHAAKMLARRRERAARERAELDVDTGGLDTTESPEFLGVVVEGLEF